MPPSEASVPTVTTPLSIPRWAFVAVCVMAGALAVPLHWVGTPASAAVFGLIGFFGLYVWRWSRLSLSIESRPRIERVVQATVSVGFGLAVGLLMLALIRFVLEPAVPSIGARMAAAGALPFWRRILIIYVASIGEELVFRLCLLSAIVGAAVRLFPAADRAPTPTLMWFANGISAFAFAAVHLPAWMGAAPMGVGLMASVLGLNAIGGLVLGYLFTRRGIGAAILAHAGADCVIQLLGPLTG